MRYAADVGDPAGETPRFGLRFEKGKKQDLEGVPPWCCVWPHEGLKQCFPHKSLW